MKGQTHFRDIQGVGNEKGVFRTFCASKGFHGNIFSDLRGCWTDTFSGHSVPHMYTLPLFAVRPYWTLMCSFIVSQCAGGKNYLYFPQDLLAIVLSLKICCLKRVILMMIVMLELTSNLIIQKINFNISALQVFFLAVSPYMPNGRKTISNFAQRPGDLILQLFSIFCQESIITDYHQLPGWDRRRKS